MTIMLDMVCTINLLSVFIDNEETKYMVKKTSNTKETMLNFVSLIWCCWKLVSLGERLD